MLEHKWTSGVWLFVARGVANLSRVLDRGGHYKRHSSLFATVDTMDSPHILLGHTSVRVIKKCENPLGHTNPFCHKDGKSVSSKIGRAFC